MIKAERFFIYSYVCLWVGVFVCTRPSDQTKNNIDLNTGTHTVWAISKDVVFYHFEKMTPRPASLEKLPCHVDFTPISLSLFKPIFLHILADRAKSLKYFEISKCKIYSVLKIPTVKGVPQPLLPLRVRP